MYAVLFMKMKVDKLKAALKKPPLYENIEIPTEMTLYELTLFFNGVFGNTK